MTELATNVLYCGDNLDSLRGRIYVGAWTGRVYVLTHHPPADAVDPTIAFLSGH